MHNQSIGQSINKINIISLINQSVNQSITLKLNKGISMQRLLHFINSLAKHFLGYQFNEIKLE